MSLQCKEMNVCKIHIKIRLINVGVSLFFSHMPCLNPLTFRWCHWGLALNLIEYGYMLNV